MNRSVMFFLVLLALNSIAAQSDTSIVPLSSIDSTIIQDVKYATENNFTGQRLYSSDKVYIRKIVGEALADVNREVKDKYNYRIKIFDGYRPLSVQKKMWTIMPDSRYVANPKFGSRHNRGAAVDVTLVNSHGEELNMGTEFDNFTEKAHPGYLNLPDSVIANRKILQSIMIQHGFHPLTTEWWHFDFSGWENFSILDVKIK